MSDTFSQSHRFGSARFADTAEIARAGMFAQQPNAVLVGFAGDRPLFYHGAGGLLTVAGARGGKFRDVLAYNLCAGTLSGNVVSLDPKGEGAFVAQDQTPDGKLALHWNPAGLHGLPQDRIDICGYLRLESPSLVSNTKVFAENAVPLSGSAQAQYFEGRAQEITEALVLSQVEQTGRLHLPDLIRVINTIPAGGDEWLNFAFEMHESRFEICRRVEAEIATSRESSSNGWQGIMGELFKSFAAFSDPRLLASVSPPYTASLEDLTRADRTYQLSLMPPAEFLQAWALAIKLIFVGAMIFKSRKPDAPQQTWIIDECGQLGQFLLAVKLYTYGAGIGIRPWAILQSFKQLKALGSDADTIVPSSAALQQVFAVRDIETAAQVSKALGTQTLEYDDPLLQNRARHAKRQAAHAILSGSDPFQAGLNLSHYRAEAELRSKQQRDLRTPSEVLNMPDDKQFIFADGLAAPIYADRKAYFDQAFMAGRFHPNPYHPPLDRVRVKTWMGHAWRDVRRGPVPERFADFPQYASGYWSRVE